MSQIAVFWTEPTAWAEIGLLRATSAREPDACPAHPRSHGHLATQVIHRRGAVRYWIAFTRQGTYSVRQRVGRNDPRWPRACACGYRFTPADQWRVNAERLYARPGTPREGALWPLRDLPVGAMYDATWMDDFPLGPGPDGIALHVQTPGGIWHVDGEASNCTRPQREQRDGKTYITARTHYCWVRHGDPRDPQGARTGQPLHVDKNGNTCAAGAGSIAMPRYHGFLHHGHLTHA